MYFHFSAKEIPSSAIRALGWGAADSCTEQGCTPIFGGSNCWEDPETGNGFCTTDYVFKGCDCSNRQDPSGGGSSPSDSNIPTPCKPIYGSTNPFAMNMNEIIGYDCSGNTLPSQQGGFPIPQYKPIMFSDDVAFDAPSNSCEGVRCIKLYKPCPEGYIDGDECCPNTGNCIPDPDYNPCAGVRCITLYKPCPEGYIDGNECCPNTGNCIPDPDYVISNVGLVQMQPISETAPVNFAGDPTTYQSNVVIDVPASQFDPTTPQAIAMQDYSNQLNDAIRSGSVSLTPPESQYTLLPIDSSTPSTNFNILDPVSMNQPVRSSTPLPFERTTPTAETPTTETPTTEEPKESGLGILVLGLIALEALAT
jgi:hypothetical protein